MSQLSGFPHHGRRRRSSRFVARLSHLKLLLVGIIASQLSSMRTCAELLDGPGYDVLDDNPTDGNFSH
jgi:hypothetical protein